MCAGFTGIDSAYEIPPNPDLVLKAGIDTVGECVEKVTDFLTQKVKLKLEYNQSNKYSI